MSNRYYQQYQNCLTESVNETEQFTTEELEIAELCLEALSSLDNYSMLKFENYLLTDQFTEAGVILEASINEKIGVEVGGGTLRFGLGDYKGKASVAGGEFTGYLKKDQIKAMSNKVKGAVKGAGREGAEAIGHVIGAGVRVAALGLAAWGAYKGGKALYGKLKTAISNWKSGTKDKDPKKLASAAKDMAAVIKQAPPKIKTASGVKSDHLNTAKKISTDKLSGGKGSSKSSSSSGGKGNPDNWGGKRPGAGRPEGS